MNRQDLADLSAFVAVAREKSFTRAAARLGITPSALSHCMRALEERLGVRLLNRTTRSVTPTEAGERMLRSVAFHLDEIETHVAALNDLRERPAGNIRITADEYSLRTVLWPRLRGVLAEHPDIKVEIEADYRLTDIVAEKFDAGVRLGESIDKDMIAVPIGPPVRMLAVATPDYFARRGRPRVPQDLAEHCCINLRLPTYGGLYAWEFERNGRAQRVRVDGQLTFNTIYQCRDAALDGFGIAYLMVDLIRAQLEDGTLEAVLEEWSPPFEGYHLFYPSRRQPTPAFAAIVEALRYRAP
ncbi:DNA-binding transcriptional LysR family regulator [Sphingomonas kyeonggiensis]|uniref:LysR family transcriptional regulator n=1 Tax=Sphingomonas kyeonggiensis TaxID=1268553 RepID=UPI00278441FC|nr:LysR family transcriptional regulator [Sphingomonas kyeonggiensis]MDQ0248900.1 DNA-binding transcriptional LysR family regulator [Sphingomonas kyeonggiensis]